MFQINNKDTRPTSGENSVILESLYKWYFYKLQNLSYIAKTFFFKLSKMFTERASEKNAQRMLLRLV